MVRKCEMFFIYTGNYINVKKVKKFNIYHTLSSRIIVMWQEQVQVQDECSYWFAAQWQTWVPSSFVAIQSNEQPQDYFDLHVPLIVDNRPHEGYGMLANCYKVVV